MIKLIVDIIMAMITIWIAYKYLNVFFKKKGNMLFVSFILWLLFFIFQIFVESQKISSLVVLFLDISFVLAIGMTGYAGTIRTKTIMVVLLYVVWMILEYFTATFLQIMNISGKKSYIIGTVFSKLFVIVLLELISRRKFENNRKISWEYWLILFTVPTGSIYITYIIYLLNPQNGESLEINKMIAFFLILFINIVIFEVYGKLAHIFEIESENAIFEQQMELLAKHTEEQKIAADAFRQEQHDFINQIIGIKSNIEKGRTEQALIVLQDLLHICTENTDTISASGNEIIDAIINYKYSIAKKKGINFGVKAFIPEQVPITQRDLCIIFGNILDNAIEAAQNSQGRYVNIYIGILKESFVIVIKNSFAGKIKRNKHGKIMTTKDNKESHGFGINSVEKVVGKYQGQVIVEIKENEEAVDKEFIITIIMGYKSAQF